MHRGRQRIEPAVALTTQLLDIGKQAGPGAAAVEQRDRMSACLQHLNHVAPEKHGAAEDNNVHPAFRSFIARYRPPTINTSAAMRIA